MGSVKNASANLRTTLTILEATENAHLWPHTYLYVRQYLMANYQIRKDLVDRLISVLIRGLLSDNTEDAFNCAWSLTNVTCAGTHNTDRLVVAGGIEALGLRLHTSSDRRVQDQCLWALGNIACENDDLARRVVMLTDPVPIATIILTDEFTTPVFRKQAAWFLHRILRFSTEFMHTTQVEEVTKALIDALLLCFSESNRTNYEMKTELVHSLMHLIDVFHRPIVQLVMYYREFTVNLMQVLHELDPNGSERFERMAMQLIGNLILGDDSDMEQLFEMNLLQFLYEQLQKSPLSSRSVEVLWICSNIAATDEKYVRHLFEGERGAYMADAIVRSLNCSSRSLTKEASYAALNTLLMFSDEPKDLKFFLDFGFFMAIAHPFIHRIEKFVEIALEVMEQCLRNDDFRRKCFAYNMDKELEACAPWIEDRLPVLRHEVREVMSSLKALRKERESGFCVQRKRAKVNSTCPFPDPYKQAITFVTDEVDCIEV